METRGRVREARASTEENRALTATAAGNESNSPLRRLSVGRSRGRQRVAQRSPSFRLTRASGPSLSARGPSAAGGAPLAVGAAREVANSTRRHTPGRRLSAAGSPTLAQADGRQRRRPSQDITTTAAARTLTRKRTRSNRRGSERELGEPEPPPFANRFPTSSVVPPPTTTSSAVPVELTGRPAKRVRGNLRRSRQQNSALRLPSPRTIAGGSSSKRDTRDMESSESRQVEGEERSDHVEQRTARDLVGTGESDRAGANALQGLLRRLGTDLGDIFPGTVGSSHSRLQQLRAAISAPDNSDHVVEALSELCEFLSVGTEESLVSFSVNLFVAPLVGLLRTGGNIEVKIYAARALTNMMEALPSSSSSIANSGAAAPLCQSLLSIEYIDLAEQSLSALHKLSVDYPQHIVQANGFRAVLSYIDFFSIGVQRVAASTACNLCRLPRTETVEMISDVLPTMMRLLDSEDQRIRESAVLGFARLADSSRSSSVKLEALCGEEGGLVEKVLGLVVPEAPAALSPQSYSSALRLLATLSRGSAALGLRILSSEALLQRLESRLSSGTSLFFDDCLVLVDSLLPDIRVADGIQDNGSRSWRRRSIGTSTAFAAVDANKRDGLENDAGALRSFGFTLFGTLTHCFASSADCSARMLCLSVLSKFMAIAPREILLEVVGERSNANTLQSSNSKRFCPFVASLLGSNSMQNEVLIGLAVADCALQKIPHLRKSFAREGIVHDICRLAAYDSGLADCSLPVDTDGRDSSGAGLDRNPAVDGVAASPSRLFDQLLLSMDLVQHSMTPRGRSSDMARSPHSVNADFRHADSKTMQGMITRAARAVLARHLGEGEDDQAEGTAFSNSILDEVVEASRLLKYAVSHQDENSGREALRKLAHLLTSPERLTVFEVSRSGLIEALAAYMTSGDLGVRRTRLASLCEYLSSDGSYRAFSAIVELVLGVFSFEEKLAVRAHEPSSGSSHYVASGLRQLAQSFRLRLQKASGENTDNLRDYSQNVVMIEPLATMASIENFLLPRVCESGKGSQRSPPAALRRNQRKVYRRGHTSDASGQEMAAMSSGEGLEASVNDEHLVEINSEGVMRNFEDGSSQELGDQAGQHDLHNNRPSDGVSSGEEEGAEHASGDSEEQDVDAVGTFDIGQIGVTSPPVEFDHEVLGQAPARLRHIPIAPGPNTADRTSSASHQSSDQSFRSYAAALAAGTPGGFGRACGDAYSTLTRQAPRSASRRELTTRPSGTPALSFSFKGRAISRDTTILNAVIQSSSDTSSISPRLWSEVHTLEYSRAREDRRMTSKGISVLGQSSVAGVVIGTSNDGAMPIRRSPRLQGNRERSRLSKLGEEGTNGAGLLQPPESLLLRVRVSDDLMSVPRTPSPPDLAPSISTTVQVLRQLYWIYRSGKRCGPIWNGDSCVDPWPDIDFHCRKTSAKLMRQLSDPLAVCGSVIPAWCYTLSMIAPFLIPFETRRILFQSTALGYVRALHLIQVRMDEMSPTTSRGSRGAREGEPRIGRMQRQKVRVHRHRILESAIKTINAYATDATVLEVQYFGEVGTGLGPTLEFYTLVSRELHRVDMKLWRSSHTGTTKEDSQGKERSATSDPRTSASIGRRRITRRGQRTIELKAPPTAEGEGAPPAFVVPTGKGLFPSCTSMASNDFHKESSEKSRALFGFVGRLMGKAIVDGRLLDLRFSEPFSRLLLSYCRVLDGKWKAKGTAEASKLRDDHTNFVRFGRPGAVEVNAADRELVWDFLTEGTSALRLLGEVDPQLKSSLKVVMDLVRAGNSGSIEDLYLTFVLPGNDTIELIPNGCNVCVTGANAEDFVRRVVFHVLYGGIQQQTEALLRGLAEVMDIRSLLLFESHELETLLCGLPFEDWNLEFLIQATRCDHGYSHESPSVMFFLQVLCELNPADQQRFVLFATGSPALPLGGLLSLRPRLTIVRRTPEAGRSADECLPTVMTCTNYFKLPEYSSYDIAHKRILYAVQEGQGSFHLS